jgi:uncharacterized protein (DUF427 family)
MWRYRGQARPGFAQRPATGQESVWDYPRPPRVERDRRLVEVRLGVDVIARTRSALRVLETASPPTFYIPEADIDMVRLVETTGSALCEWKGLARYRAMKNSPEIPVAWYYQDPTSPYAAIGGHTSFYPGRIDCFVEGERVQPQPGGFYGGWITHEIVGPFKGAPGTNHW